MKVAKVDEAQAEKIEYQMECNGVNFSDCSTRMFNRSVKEAIEDMAA